MNLIIAAQIILTALLVCECFLNYTKIHSEGNLRASKFKGYSLSPNPQIIDISAQNYPQPEDEKQKMEFETIAIIGTADIHGRILPKQHFTLDTNQSYEVGGLLYFNSYLKILKEEWKENLIWLDAGDQFQGTIESNEFSGEALVESLNYQNVSQYFTAVIGNHEFDFGVYNLTNRIKQANFDYINSNILNAETNTRESFSKTKAHKIIKAGSLKVGIFGLCTIRTPQTTAMNVSNYTFDSYVKVAEEESKALKNAGADIVLLTAHVGTVCGPEDSDDLLKNDIRFENTTQFSECSQSDELYEFLHKLPAGLVDGVIAGHTHNLVHHWINGIPVIQSSANNRYFNILYFKYDKLKKRIVKGDTKIEGPIPVCEKVFDFTHRCETDFGQIKTKGHLSLFSFHKKPITIDNDLHEHLKPYMKRAEDYQNTVFGFVENPMINSRAEETALGNFVTDFIKMKSHADIVFTNSGMMRVGWPKGKLTRYQLYETFPFEDTIVSCEMTGEELDKVIRVLQSGMKSFYSTAGLKQVAKNNPNRVVNLSLYDGTPLEREKTYIVGTVEFVLNGGDDFKKVRTFYSPRNVKKHGKFREKFGEFIKSMGKLNTNNNPLIDKDKPRLIVINDRKKLSNC